MYCPKGFCIESLKILMCVGPCSLLTHCSLTDCSRHTFLDHFGTLHVLPSKQFLIFCPKNSSKKGSKVWHLDKLHGFDHQKLQNCLEGSKRRVQKEIVLGEIWIWCFFCHIFSSWRVSGRTQSKFWGSLCKSPSGAILPCRCNLVNIHALHKFEISN